jgi:hypothetical protein
MLINYYFRPLISRSKILSCRTADRSVFYYIRAYCLGSHFFTSFRIFQGFSHVFFFLIHIFSPRPHALPCQLACVRYHINKTCNCFHSYYIQHVYDDLLANGRLMNAVMPGSESARCHTWECPVYHCPCQRVNQKINILRESSTSRVFVK